MKLPFPNFSACQKFEESFYLVVAALNRQSTYEIMNPRNVESFRHGVKWRTHSGDEEAKKISTMTQHTAEISIGFKQIVGHELTTLPNAINSIVETMRSQLMNSLFEVVTKSTEKSGNVVSAKEFPSGTEAFLETIRKIKFGVDETGKVTFPEIHVGPGNPLQEQLANASPEFMAKVDEITAQKSAEALEEERQRISKYKA